MLALGLGLVAALLADLQDEFGFPTWGLGVIAGISYLTGFAGHLGLGPLADRGHVHALLVAGILAGVGSLLWLAAATELWQFVAARAVFGLAEGAFLPAARRLVLVWRPDRPGAELGSLLGAAMTGFVGGPIAGGLLAEAFGLRAAFVVPAVATALALPLVWRIRYTDLPRSRARSPFTLLRRPLVRAAVLLGGSEFFMIGGLEAIWARLVTDRGASTAEVGLTLTIVVIPVALLTPVAGRLADRIDPARLALGAVAVLGLSVPLLGFVETVVLTVVVGTAQGVFSAITAPAAQALTSRGSPSDQIAAGQGLLDGLGLVLAAVAALPVGWVYETFGARWLGVSLAIPVVVMWVLGFGEVRRSAGGVTARVEVPTD
jgi:MFS family permease